MLDVPLARARYAVGSCVRWLSAPWRQRDIASEQATTIFGCSFGAQGWHHIRATLQAYDADSSIPVEMTPMWRFLRDFQPDSISTLAGVYDEPPLPLFVYPWGTFNGGAEASDKDPSRSRFCGPSSKEFVQEEYARTIALYREVRRAGYRPYEYPNSFIGGTWLLASCGDSRFVVMQGNHRMAALAHLGARQVAVRTMTQALHSVREDELDRWPLVASGRCSPAHARKVFRLFFEQDGRHIQRLLGAG